MGSTAGADLYYRANHDINFTYADVGQWNYHDAVREVVVGWCMVRMQYWGGPRRLMQRLEQSTKYLLLWAFHRKRAPFRLPDRVSSCSLHPCRNMTNRPHFQGYFASDSVNLVHKGQPGAECFML